jgi:hypothetical protein
VWVPPHASTGTRRHKKNGKGSFKGSHVSYDSFEIVTESDLEADVFYWLEARRDVVRVREQWPSVIYVGVDGEDHTHTFDFHIELANGRRTAIAVRPSGRTTVLRETLQLIHEQQRLARFADSAVIITDDDVTKDDSRNAQNILRARKVRDEHEVHAALSDLSSAYGSIRFYDLIKHSSEPGLRRSALWCLIYEGILVPVDRRERITDTTILRFSRAIH